MDFWLGTHHPSWLTRVGPPLFVSHQRLRSRKHFKRAARGWALDSGGFTEVATHGAYRWSVEEYVEAVHRYSEEIGRLSWAAPMDWMCEPFVVERTGLSVREHQERTVQNYLDLRGRGLFVPVLQGWTLADYEVCLGLYAEAGVPLASLPLVGVGSVCRRQAAGEIGAIMAMLATEGISTHGFGVKMGGVRMYGDLLASSDSLAWSYGARRSDPLPGCTHANCANCELYALAWRERLLASIPRQMSLLT